MERSKPRFGAVPFTPEGFLYQAASWKAARRVVAKVEFHLGSCSPASGSS
jgi:hypothetical protein